tara:strand:- start:349 stop:921 length:573 start_codon:yes stop_codon:yes gene_type:complete
MIPLALLPYAPAAAAGIGALAKGAQRYGPQILQGGINTLNKMGQSPFISNLANRFNLGYAPNAVGKSGKVGNLFSQFATPGGFQSGLNPLGSENLNEIGNEIKDQEFFREVDTSLTDGQVFKKVDELTKKIKDIFSDDEEEPKKKKKKEEPSLDLVPMKKGGHAKKQRKRKHYKSSGFVRMKKSKKRKYI